MSKKLSALLCLLLCFTLCLAPAVSLAEDDSTTQQEEPSPEEVPQTEEASPAPDEAQVVGILNQTGVNQPDPDVNLNSASYRLSATATPGSHPTTPVEYAFDNDFTTRWSSSGTSNPVIVEVLYNDVYNINEILLREYWSRMSPVTLEYLMPGTTDQWEEFYTCDSLGHDVDVVIDDFGTIAASGLRLVTQRAGVAVSLYEFQARYIGAVAPDPEPNPYQHRVAAGIRHSLYVDDEGSVWFWGNKDAMLGGKAAADQLTAVRVLENFDAVSVAAGDNFSLVLKADGTVWAWGDNTWGTLGDGTQTYRPEPVQVSGLTDVVQIAANGYHSLALKEDGTVWGWGYNTHGQLGLNRIMYLVPFQLDQDAVSISAGGGLESHILKSDGKVYQYYGNLAGVPIPGLEGAKYISTGVGGFVLTDGTVFTWPLNFGTGMENATKIAIAWVGMHCVLKEDGTLWMRDKNIPWQQKAVTDIVDIAGSGGHLLALQSDGTVWSWGENLWGRLGNGTTQSVLYPSDPTQVMFS